MSISPSTAILTVVVLYSIKTAWDNAPSWIKDHFDKNDKTRGTDGSLKDANDDLANPASIVTKLQDMFNLMYRESDDLLPDEMPWYKLYVCFISFLHNRAEVSLVHPEMRDETNRAEGLKPHLKEVELIEEYAEYAEWAYDGSIVNLQKLLREKKMDLIRLDTATEPGRVGHFIVSDKATKRIIVAIKGTSTFSDVLTDLVGTTVLHGNTRYHEGMYTAAQMMLDDLQPLLQEFFLPAGYNVVITGHSLGAGVACLLGALLKDSIPELVHNKKKRLSVFAYATPACMSYDACLRCKDYMTSVVNNTDCVPRLSVCSMRILHRMLLRIDQALVDKGLDPSDWTTASKYAQDLLKIDDDLLLTKQQLTVCLDKILKEEEPNMQKDYAIFVPGKVVCVWECSEADALTVDARVGTAGMASVRVTDVATTMVTDHGTANYRKNLACLLKEAKSNSKFEG